MFGRTNLLIALFAAASAAASASASAANAAAPPAFVATAPFAVVGQCRRSRGTPSTALRTAASSSGGGGGHPGSSASATMDAPPSSSASTDEAARASFIDTELRGAAMRLHTRSQSPKEGRASPTPAEMAPEPYVPTHADYLQFLVDSLAVYEAFEIDVVEDGTVPREMERFLLRTTGLERVDALEKDIEFMCTEFGLTRPNVGKYGREYAEEIRRIAAGAAKKAAPSAEGEESKEKKAVAGSVPELMCHYYNYYFAHTAGGRMIGKQMAKLLLDGRTLEFYKWDDDLNAIKSRVKSDIEALAATWTREEKDECVAATAATFRGGGGINSYLSGGRRGH